MTVSSLWKRAVALVLTILVASATATQDFSWFYGERYLSDKDISFQAQKMELSGAQFVFSCYDKELKMSVKGKDFPVGFPVLRFRIGNQVRRTVALNEGSPSFLKQEDLRWVLTALLSTSGVYGLHFQIGNPLSFEIEVGQAGLRVIRRVLLECSTAV